MTRNRLRLLLLGVSVLGLMALLFGPYRPESPGIPLASDSLALSEGHRPQNLDRISEKLRTALTPKRKKASTSP